MMYQILQTIFSALVKSIICTNKMFILLHNFLYIRIMRTNHMRHHFSDVQRAGIYTHSRPVTSHLFMGQIVLTCYVGVTETYPGTN